MPDQNPPEGRSGPPGATRSLLPSDGGEAGALVRAHNWEASPLGPPEGWPQPLRTLVAVMLGSRQPMFVTWGPTRVLLYNDGYAPMLGLRHPAALGRPFGEVWSEVWPELASLFERADAGESTHMDDIALTLGRYGYPEEAHFAFSYTPVRDEAGGVAGLFCACTETTAKVRAERRLAAEGERLRRLFHQAPGFMCVLRGPAHVFEIANAAYAGLVGHRDLIGRPVAEALPEAKSQGFLGLLDRVYATGEAFAARQARFDLRRGPGAAPETRFLDFVYQPITDEDGRVSGIFVEGSDVTEAKRGADALRRERDRSRATLESMAEGFLLLDPGFRITEINAEGLRIDGRPRGEIVGRHLLEVWPEAEAMPPWPAYREAMAGRTPVALEYRHASGVHDVWLEMRAYPLADGGLAVFYRDVTERKRAEHALRESEARFRHMADSAPALIWMTDAQGRVTFANMHYDHVFGRPAAEMLDEGWAEVVLPEDFGPFQTAFLDAFQARRPFRAEVRARDKHGGVRWLRCEGVPRLDDAGTFLGYTGCNVDITEARLAADAQEARVTERTAELRQALGQLHEEVVEREQAEAALRQAQKMEAVGQLTGGIAHDFNNMLQGIVGSLELVRTRLARGQAVDVERFISAAMGAAQRASVLTNRLLAFARRQALDPKPVDVNRLVADVQELIRRTVGPSIAVETALAAGLWPTLCDANQLENALLNLAINARDAMSGGPLGPTSGVPLGTTSGASLGSTPDGGRLTIETANVRLDEAYARGQGDQLAPGEYVRIGIADTGTGMSAEVASRVFEPFFTTKPIGQGTGLGLSMVYGFVKQSGGHLSLDTREGRGTTVRLYLPRHDRVADAGETGDAAGPAAQAGAGETVLVVEDEALVRELAVETLEGMGYSVLQAPDGANALRVLRSAARVDLLVTDVGLPGMNGRQLADAAREHRPGLKVLFITGYAHNAAVGGALEPGMALIGKPFALDALAAKVRGMIEG